MERFTLDTNCIIDLEENRPNAVHVRRLMSAWDDGRIELAVVAVSASENQRNGPASRDFSAFEKKLAKVGLSEARHLLPLNIWDVTYWDHALWPDEELEAQAKQIRAILFPGIKEHPPESIAERSNWRNRLCDVLVAWSHAYHKGDYLVTSDRNFEKHKDELRRFGIFVLSPEDAAQMCD